VKRKRIKSERRSVIQTLIKYKIYKDWEGRLCTMDNNCINQETTTPLLGNMLDSGIKFTLDILSIDRLSFQLASILHETSVEITWKLMLHWRQKKKWGKKNLSLTKLESLFPPLIWSLPKPLEHFLSWLNGWIFR